MHRGFCQRLCSIKLLIHVTLSICGKNIFNLSIHGKKIQLSNKRLAQNKCKLPGRLKRPLMLINHNLSKRRLDRVCDMAFI